MSDIETWARIWSVPEGEAEAARSELRLRLLSAWRKEKPALHAGVMRNPWALGQLLLEVMGIDLTPLPEEYRLLITNTTPQHRIELFPQQGESIPGLSCYDGRAMYLACCDGLGFAGKAFQHWHPCSGSVPDILPHERGRAKVEATCPHDWNHIGLLPYKNLIGGWEWPVSPVWQFKTWADLSEIRLARQHGWQVEVLEKLTWPEGKPLDNWAHRLTKLYTQAKEEGNDALAGCFRAIALHTIGSFHNLGYKDHTETVERDDPRATLNATIASVSGGLVVRTREQTAKPDLFKHPEWSAAIWSRARLRVAKAMLQVPFDSLVGVWGDAVYTTGDDNALDGQDDGKVGRFRWKGGNVCRNYDNPLTWKKIGEVMSGKR